jgi:dTDP-4-amino-4,6-dideoxygalactose transaminase
MSDQTVVAPKIPCLDLKKQYLTIKDEIRTAIDEVLDNTAYSGGPFVEKFEKNLAVYCGTKYALGVNTGTSALHLAMMALGLGEGDEVILPANTFIATAWGVSYVNATPVFVDCDPNTWNIDPAKIEASITPKTKAIIGVHLYGQPYDIEAVAAIAKKHNLYMVEDCAQAIGAKYKEVKVGGFGEMGCFSFYPGKNLGAYGEGGGMTMNNEKYYKHIQSLRNHGSVERYYHDELGFNFRMDGIQGAVLDVKLQYIDAWNSRRKEIAKAYQSGINNPKIKVQEQPEWSDSIYHLFVVTTEDRDGLMKYLQSHNIFPGLHYPVPCHLQKVYSGLGYKKGDFPNSEFLADHCLSLPMFSELSDEEVSRVIEVTNNY